jgi:hypothetical protein
VSIDEIELRAHVKRCRFFPDHGERNIRIFTALRKITDKGSVFWSLADTPGQAEDYIVLLLDDHTIVFFELARSNSSAEPEEVEVKAVDEYRSSVSDLARLEMDLALEFARKELS